MMEAEILISTLNPFKLQYSGVREIFDHDDKTSAGIVNYKFKDFTAAVEDLSACVKVDKDNKSAYTYLVSPRLLSFSYCIDSARLSLCLKTDSY